MTKGNRKTDEQTALIGSQVLFHGIDCRVKHAYDNYRYRLVAMGGTYEQLQKDSSFTEYHEWGAVARPIICPNCKEITWFDDTHIPRGTRYEIACSKCSTILKRKA